MRPAAQVDPAALAVHRQLFAGRQFADPFGLEAFAGLLGNASAASSRSQTSRTISSFAVDDLVHARLDRLEVRRREGLLAVKIVVEAVFRRRAEGDLRTGIKLLHRLGQDMGGVVPDQLQRRVVLERDDFDRRIRLDRAGEIAQFAVDPDRQRRFRQARTDRGRDIRARHRRRILPDAAVGQGDRDRPVRRISVGRISIWRRRPVCRVHRDV